MMCANIEFFIILLDIAVRFMCSKIQETKFVSCLLNKNKSLSKKGKNTYGLSHFWLHVGQKHIFTQIIVVSKASDLLWKTIHFQNIPIWPYSYNSRVYSYEGVGEGGGANLTPQKKQSFFNQGHVYNFF